jgi:hypothetical protein
MNDQYQNYMDALDTCIKLSETRAFAMQDGSLSSEELKKLETKYFEAVLRAGRKRQEWVLMRDAQRERMNELE